MVLHNDGRMHVQDSKNNDTLTPRNINKTFQAVYHINAENHEQTNH